MAVILDNKAPQSPSLFRPEALLRQARGQKAIARGGRAGNLHSRSRWRYVRRLRKEGRSKPFENRPCYDSQLDTFELAGQIVGIVGCAVGAPFAVLIAEELFASDCRLLLSVTSSGQIVPAGQLPILSSSTAR